MVLRFQQRQTSKCVFKSKGTTPTSGTLYIALRDIFLSFGMQVAPYECTQLSVCLFKIVWLVSTHVCYVHVLRGPNFVQVKQMPRGSTIAIKPSAKALGTRTGPVTWNLHLVRLVPPPLTASVQQQLHVNEYPTSASSICPMSAPYYTRSVCFGTGKVT
jgi:hypothetical protein